MLKIKDIYEALVCFGPKPILQGTVHKILKKTGYMKMKFPVYSWQDVDIKYFLKEGLNAGDLKDYFKSHPFAHFEKISEDKHSFENLNIDTYKIIERADDVLNNKFILFFKRPYFTEGKINWHVNPFNDAVWPRSKHWSQFNYFVDELGDIKSVWELSRFSWAYDLARAYIITKDGRYSEKFWMLFESWMEQNHPNLGVNWVSGQECAIRLMACCFSLFAFLDDISTTKKRLKDFTKFVAVHMKRIEGFIGHAIRQKTNHSILEATGLYTVGLLFPFMKKADIWKNKGKKILIKEILRQIYDDGSYVQHSMNYHRLMLQAVTWALMIAQNKDDAFPNEFIDRVNKSVMFIYQMQDSCTGRVPNYGANDGALILPLNNCDYLDYRPAIQACYYALNKKKIFADGQFMEDLLWLFGPESLNAEMKDIKRTSSRFDAGGYYTLRQKGNWAMLRCHSYIDRVSQVDMMHLDFWADGENLLRDCGSYRYFVPDEPKMEEYFKSIYAHNTVIIDGQSPLRKALRFMYLPWPKAEIKEFNVSDNKMGVEGLNLAYVHKPWEVEHLRSVRLEDEACSIIDNLFSLSEHTAQLRWHLHPEASLLEQGPKKVIIQLPNAWMLSVSSDNIDSFDILNGQNNGGWQSLYYSEKTFIKTLVVNAKLEKKLSFETKIYKYQG